MFAKGDEPQKMLSEVRVVPNGDHEGAARHCHGHEQRMLDTTHGVRAAQWWLTDEGHEVENNDHGQVQNEDHVGDEDEDDEREVVDRGVLDEHLRVKSTTSTSIGLPTPSCILHTLRTSKNNTQCNALLEMCVTHCHDAAVYHSSSLCL